MSLRNIPNAISMEFLSAKQATKKMTLGEKIKYMATHITVEPIIFLYILPGTMGLLATQNMNLEKACRVNLKYSTSICDAMVRRDRTGYEEYQEAEVQRLVAKMLTIKTAVIGFFPTIVVLFTGSWSDRHQRRKPVILIPIVCDILSGVGLLVCAYFLLEVSVEYVTFFDCFPYALGGGWSCTFLGAFSYISGLSSEEDRTIRVGALSMLQNVAMTIGNVVGGALIGPLGFEGSYILSIILMSTCVIYGLIAIKDVRNVETTYLEEKKSFVGDFFDIDHVKTTFKICFKDGSSNRKWKMIVIMIATVMINGPLHGELAVLYLYTRIKFGWNEVNFSIYNTLQFIVQILGSVFALSYFSKKLKFDDAILGIIALVSKISACFVYSFAPNGQYFFLGCFVEIFHGTCHIALRSLMSKIVPPHELGQANSLFGVCEALMPFMFGPFYTTLYNYTIKVFPGAFYMVSATLYVITIPLFIWLYKCNKEDKKMSQLKRTQQQQEENLMMTIPEENNDKTIDTLKS